MAKYAKVEVSLDLLTLWLSGNWNIDYEVSTNAPSDLKVLGVSPVGRGWPPISAYILCTSEAFEDIPELSEIPILKPFVYTLKVRDKNG